MEIKFNNLTYKDKKKTLLKKINIKIKNNLITGIMGSNSYIIADILTNTPNYKGEVLINNSILEYDNEKISYIKKLDKDTFLTKTVSDEFYLKKKNIKDNNYLEKITSSLNMVGLNKDYLEKEISSLSKSEKRLLQIALNLVTNPELIIIDEPYLYLDSKAIYNIKKIILDLKDKYNKTIIILSLDTNILYELTDDVIILKNNQVLISGKTSLIFKDYEFLNTNKIILPDIIKMKQILLEKDVNIDFKDIDELVKGVINNDKEDKDES